MIQNFIVQRFSNKAMTALWHRDQVDAIEITSFEKIGVEDRGGYYDDSGVIRDMVQNHLLQILVLATMEPPQDLSADAILASKIDLLQQLHCVRCKRYQYNGYRSIAKVKPDSVTATYVELEFRIDNDRWRGVPVFIRTGKKMPFRRGALALVLRATANSLYPRREEALITSIQPSEGVLLIQQTKIPGMGLRLGPTGMRYSHDEAFGNPGFDAYARLLYDALAGDRTLFVDGTENSLAWEKVEQVLANKEINFYEPGSIPTDGLRDHWVDIQSYLNYYGM